MDWYWLIKVFMILFVVALVVGEIIILWVLMRLLTLTIIECYPRYYDLINKVGYIIATLLILIFVFLICYISAVS